MSKSLLQQIVAANKRGERRGICSVCSANEDVLRAVLRRARTNGCPALIESTANQVNQFGGYTAMTPADFASFVRRLAAEEDVPAARVILGGDHLGPLTWTDLPEEEALRNAEQLVADCVRAGYAKIHLDTSMRVASDDADAPFPASICATRGARLAAACEQAYQQLGDDADPPCYVIGSEVPVPGGDLRVDARKVSDPADALQTIEAYRKAFNEAGLTNAFGRVIALVLEMGVEFHEWTLDEYDRSRTAELVAAMRETPLAIEGHSTDYQTPAALRALCEDGVAILKVGPGFTFAAREALFALENVERELFCGSRRPLSNLRRVLDAAMRANPKYWASYHQGTKDEQSFARAYSFYDRARYYLGDPQVQTARQLLLDNLASAPVPLPLLGQYLPAQYERVRAATLRNEPHELLYDHIGDAIDPYLAATGGDSAERIK
ncbi:MAG: class II D-tagatose-bisphosphate aldolase, non-catalytic subunit [Actinomycetia bacterium]|nr:class II D-tagatose-bisphosphate aldolase, non-catalytic subunit [Actinomycetes bacterium]